MSAGTQGFAQDPDLTNRPNMRAGYTSISSGAMHQLVEAVAAEAFNVPLREVRAGVHDEQGQVSVSLAVPLTNWGLSGGENRLESRGLEPVKNDGGTVFERAASARTEVAARVQTLAGTVVGRVDIRFTGIQNGTQATAGRLQ